MLPGSFIVTTLEKEERKPVVRPRKRGVERECAVVRPHCIVQPPEPRVRNRHVLQNAGIVRSIAQGKAVGSDGTVEITLPLEIQGLGEVVEALRL